MLKNYTSHLSLDIKILNFCILVFSIIGILTFTTTTHAQTDIQAPSSPPQILNIQIEPALGSDIRVTWDTDRPTIGYVDLSLKRRFVARLHSPGGARTHHEIVISRLIEKTEYRAILKVRDEGDHKINNFTRSSERTFTTGTASDSVGPEVTTSSVKIYFISSKTAYISFHTSEPASALVRYGQTKGRVSDFKTYSSSKKSRSSSRIHDVVLTNLIPNAGYHFQIRVWDKAKNYSNSKQFTFGTTKDLKIDFEKLTISHIQPASLESELISPYTVTTTWRSNRPTGGVVKYKAINSTKTHTAPTPSPKNTQQQVVLKDLEPNTKYTYSITASDGTDQQAKISGLSFTTKDGPKKISTITTDKKNTGTKTTVSNKNTKFYTPTSGIYRVHGSTENWTIMRGQRIKISDNISFNEYGYKTSDIKRISQAQLEAYPLARYVKLHTNKTVYRIYPDKNVKLAFSKEEEFRSYSDASFNKVITINQDDLDSFRRPRLLKVNGRPFLYSMDSNGQKHLLKNGATTAAALGFDTADAIVITLKHLSSIPSGRVL